jgi:hypothetical protein
VLQRCGYTWQLAQKRSNARSGRLSDVRGAKRNLPEPTVDKIYMFADKLKEYGIELREKHNLSRLTK